MRIRSFTFALITTVILLTGCLGTNTNNEAQNKYLNKISAGGLHSAAIKKDGTLWAWGNNSWGQIGDGTTENKINPVQVGTDNDWAQVIAQSQWGYEDVRDSNSFTLALKKNGTLWGWGRLYYAFKFKIGDSTVPIQIGTENNWSMIAADNWYKVLGIKSDGTLWEINGTDLVQIGTDNNWSEVTVNDNKISGIKTDGTLWEWGQNPVQLGIDNKWFHVDAGYNFKVAVKKDGTLWAWGKNYYGQLGNASTTDVSDPIQITTDNDWIHADAGNSHTVGLKADGTLWAWGANDYGQLGNGEKINYTIPVKIGDDKDWAYAVAEGYNTIAIKTDGTVWVWGRNIEGQLGDGIDIPQYQTPGKKGNGENWVFITSKNGLVMAIKSDGTLWGWGNDNFIFHGLLGNDEIHNNTPVQIGTESNWSKVYLSSNNIFTKKTDGTLWSWEHIFSNDIFDNEKINIIPIQITAETNWAELFLSDYDYGALALKTDGTLWGWGQNDYGQLGLSNESINTPTPTQIGTDTNWVKIFRGPTYTLAIKTDGSLWGWGRNVYGVLGDGIGNISQIGTDTNWDKISIVNFFGYSSIFGIKSDSTLWKWGWGITVPTQVGTETSWLEITGSVALKKDGTIWDLNSLAQIGTDTDWVKIYEGEHRYYVAVKTNGTLWGWGENHGGILGYDKPADITSPVQIGIENSWLNATILPEYQYIIGIQSDGSFWGWGSNKYGAYFLAGIDFTIYNRYEPFKINLKL